jgi:uncharacterized protein with beta-barrel porin domain
MTMRSSLFRSAAIASIACVAAPALADIDTMPSWNGTSFISSFGVPNTATYGQTITATTLNSRLNSFSFQLYLQGGVASQYQAYVYQWNGTKITGSALYTSAITNGPSAAAYTTVSFNTGGIMLTPGQQYVLFLTTSTITGQSSGSYRWGSLTNDSTYTGGNFVFMNNTTDFSLLSANAWSVINEDLAFTAALLPSSLIALLPSGTGTNPTNVAAGIDNAVINHGNMPVGGVLALYSLSGSALTDALSQASGEIGADLALAGRSVLRPLLTTTTDRFSDPGFELPAGKGYNLWGTMLGQLGDATGDAGVVSHDVKSRSGGFLVGLDYAVAPGIVIGAATGWQRSDINIGSLGTAGGGHFQLGAYGNVHFADAAYVSGVFGASFGQLNVHRMLTVSGTDVFATKVDVRSLGGRLEGGYRFETGGYDLTPYGAVQIESYHLPGYSENTTSGSNSLALTYMGRDENNWRTELGATLGRTVPLTDEQMLRFTLRGAWVYDDHANEVAHAAFTGMSYSDFMVYGATLSKSAGLFSVGLQTFNKGPLSVGAKFTGVVGNNAESFSGSFTLNYAL